MVSLEVSPDLAHDVDGTVEVRELFARLDPPNIMIKVPGTVPGLHAVETTDRRRVNVNVTLLFSVERYVSVAEAYLRGLERRRALGLPLDRIASVASFSSAGSTPRSTRAGATAAGIAGARIANANAKLAYQEYLEIFGGAHFPPCAHQGPTPNAH